MLAVEPGGADYVPLGERHGKPWQLFATWLSPNMEFATVFVGVLGVQVFGLTFPVAIVALVLGIGGGLDHSRPAVGARSEPRRAADGREPNPLWLAGKHPSRPG